MKNSALFLSLSAAILLLAACSSKPAETESSETAVVETVTDEPHDIEIVITGADNMQFGLNAFEVTEGQRVKLVFNNLGNLPKDSMGHNVVILAPGTDIMAFAMEATKYRKNEYIPTDEVYGPTVLHHTKLLGPKESDTIYFTAGAPGEYPFICSFPAHASLMQGVMTVKAK